MTLKPGLWVNRGHRNRHRSIRHLWFPINVPYSNRRPISYRFWDIRRFQAKIAKFSHPPFYYAYPLKGLPVELGTGRGIIKLEWWRYQVVEKVVWYKRFSRLDGIPACDGSIRVSFDDLEWPLTRVSRSLYSYKSNISKTVRLRDKVTKEHFRKP